MRDYPHVRHLFAGGHFSRTVLDQRAIWFLDPGRTIAAAGHTLAPWLKLRSRCAFGLLLGFLFLRDLAQPISHPAQSLPLRFVINVVVLWSC
jgi:hypothetical protein